MRLKISWLSIDCVQISSSSFEFVLKLKRIRDRVGLGDSHVDAVFPCIRLFLTLSLVTVITCSLVFRAAAYLD